MSGNATTNDLWAALSEASGKDVKTFMDAWITKIGFPVVTVAEEPGQIGVQQSRFLSAGDVNPEEDTTQWWIPLGLKTANNATPASQELATKAETLRNVDESFYKFNSYQNGFYRTNYPPERLAKLGAEKSKLAVEDRIGLVADAEAMAVAGLGTTAGLLTLVEKFQDESSKAVFAQIAGSLATIRSAFAENEAVTRGLQAFTQQLFSPVAEKVGWKQAQGEDYLTGQLRALAIRVVGGAGHQKVIQEAQRQFAAYVSGDKTAIHPSLRIPVFRIVIENGGASEYKALKNEYAQTTSIDGKDVCLTAMGQVPTAELAKDFLDFQFSDEVATQDVHTGSISLASNPKGRRVLWDYFRSEWKTVSNKLAARPIIMDRYIKSTLSKYASQEMEQSISDFFKDKNTEGYDRGLQQVLDKVRTNARYRERDEMLVLEWLQAHQYA
ncbi:uncharacterized protein KY384_000276 [Bacidia gigantensis]|uniref:uncharacterized protein n=1 Tax=Bacidia gigantensis TaxID=2732470 RepID=UPI001D05385A|nr:uncharacterized protein KY384_000276 [Bacidia gigantensis]KAG8526283.1 hypothetical protein KY384_000276 [Bacidia gigantensis]